MSRPGMEGQTASKLSYIKDWVFDHLEDIRHERRVAWIARSLFRIADPIHQVTRKDLRLVTLAAYLHDVGRCEDDKNHPAIGARMIRREHDLPLKKRQRRLLAYLALRHRGRVPDIQDDPALQNISDPRQARLLLAFLRAADALDSRCLPSPRLGFSRRGQRIRIVCRLRHDSPKARRIFSRRKKFRLLEELLDCKVDVILIGRRVRAAA
jgi:exopolyphosphatase/pppGpp-phosphohydrolase